VLLRFKYNHFLPGSEPTSGVEVVTHSTNTADGGFVNARIWDTGFFREAIPDPQYYRYCRDAAGILIVYDIANYASYANVVHWLTEIRNHTNSKTVLTLVGNKSDLISRRAVSTEEASQFSLKNGLRFMETSAMTAMNVRFVFDTLFSGSRSFFVREYSRS
ncbi:GTPase, partial [Mycena rebaudengoi]